MPNNQEIRWDGPIIAVDWGTSNRRAYLVNRGRRIDLIEDARGVRVTPKEAFADEILALRSRWGELPVLLAGMVGSTLGWHTTAYINCPATLDNVAHAVVVVEPGVVIVPGLCVQGRTPDIMRGEEVQAFGVLSRPSFTKGATICHPGTHFKWIGTNKLSVTSLHTTMTGELHSLIRDHSVLKEFITGVAVPDKNYLEGVEAGADGRSLQAALFNVRASILTGSRQASSAASFLSGLLIGDAIASLPTHLASRPIIVLGRSDLAELCMTALLHLKMSAEQLEDDEAFCRGAAAIALTLAARLGLE